MVCLPARIVRQRERAPTAVTPRLRKRMIDSARMPRPLRFLVGVDFSPESRKALSVARELAGRSGAELTIAHVRPFSDIRAAVTLERGELLRGRSRSMAAEIRALFGRRLSSLAR